MNDLIARLERAEGPARELDCRIWCAMRGEDFDLYSQVVSNFNEWQALRYTASIDAALTLVPEGYDWGIGALDAFNERPWAWALPTGASWIRNDTAATPALALCIAALRAHQKDTDA